MILAIDVGNSNIVLGCVDGNQIQSMLRMTTDKTKTDDEYAVQIKSILQMHNVIIEDIEDCIISSVVPSLTNVLKHAVKLIIGKNAKVIGTNLKTGLDIKIDNPHQLGSDLIVNAVAVKHNYPLPAIIIDMGTATTFSVMNDDTTYLGGMILPGVESSLRILTSNTAQLPNISIERPEHLIGKNTVECMRSGIINGNAALIDGIVQRIEEELGKSATVIATGGLASMIYKYCKHNIVYDEKLLLKGLSIIYEINK